MRYDKFIGHNDQMQFIDLIKHDYIQNIWRSFQDGVPVR